MSKLAQRLLIFFIGIPLVLAIVFFDFNNHLLMHLVLLVVIVISSFEMHTILKTKSTIQPKILLSILSLLPFVMSYICNVFSLSFEYIYLVFIFSVLFSLAYEVFFSVNKGENNFEHSLYSSLSNVLVIFYCGLLPTFLSQISAFNNSSKLLCVFFLLVFACDSFAWLFGMLFGKNNRGLIKVSPNKSISGFIGGILSTIGISVLCKVLFPDVFTGSYIKNIVLGFVIAISSILGDLVESLFKRSASCKDSGQVIIGRGGILDSIDSILFSAPLYFILVKFFY